MVYFLMLQVKPITNLRKTGQSVPKLLVSLLRQKFLQDNSAACI